MHSTGGACKFPSWSKCNNFGGGHNYWPRFSRIAATIYISWTHVYGSSVHPQHFGPASCKYLDWKVMNSGMLPRVMMTLCRFWHCPCTGHYGHVTDQRSSNAKRWSCSTLQSKCVLFLQLPSSPEITLLWAWCKPWSYSGHSSCEIYHHNRYRHCGAHSILPMLGLWSRKCSQFEHSTPNSENGSARSQNGSLQKWLELKLRPHDNHAVVALDAHQHQAMNWNHQVSVVEYQHLNKTHLLAGWESLLVLPVSEDQVRMARQLVASHGGPSACKTQRSPHEPWTWKSRKLPEKENYSINISM